MLDLTGATLIGFDMSECVVSQIDASGARFIGDTSFKGIIVGRDFTLKDITAEGPVDLTGASRPTRRWASW